MDLAEASSGRIFRKQKPGPNSPEIRYLSLEFPRIPRILKFCVPQIPRILKILVDPQDRNTLYLATQNQGVWISNDAGENWRPWNDGLRCREAGTNGNNVANVLALSADGRTLYFATLGAGVWRRTIKR